MAFPRSRLYRDFVTCAAKTNRSGETSNTCSDDGNMKSKASDRRSSCSVWQDGYDRIFSSWSHDIDDYALEHL